MTNRDNSSLEEDDSHDTVPVLEPVPCLPLSHSLTASQVQSGHQLIARGNTDIQAPEDNHIAIMLNRLHFTFLRSCNLNVDGCGYMLVGTQCLAATSK
jgi:hypothetical protein